MPDEEPLEIQPDTRGFPARPKLVPNPPADEVQLPPAEDPPSPVKRGVDLSRHGPAIAKQLADGVSPSKIAENYPGADVANVLAAAGPYTKPQPLTE